MPPTTDPKSAGAAKPVLGVDVLEKILDINTLKQVVLQATNKAHALTAKLDNYAHGFASELDGLNAALTKLNDHVNASLATSSVVAPAQPLTSTPNPTGKPLPAKEPAGLNSTEDEPPLEPKTDAAGKEVAPAPEAEQPPADQPPA